MSTHVWHLFQSPPISCRQLHDFRLEPLLGGIPHHRLREHGGLVIRRDPWRHAWLWEISYDIAMYCGDELIMEPLDVGVCFEEVADFLEEFILSKLTYKKQKCNPVSIVHTG